MYLVWRTVWKVQPVANLKQYFLDKYEAEGEDYLGSEIVCHQVMTFNDIHTIQVLHEQGYLDFSIRGGLGENMT